MTDGTGLSRRRYEDLLDARVRRPRSLRDALRQRERRDLVGPDGRLLVVAADHTARGKVGVGGDPLGAADRFTLLDRLVRLLAVPGVDGVLGSADVLEDLAWLGALDGRLAIGVMNRGGIVGARWELDDRMTAYDAERVAASGLDGGKVMIRLDVADPGVPRTLEAVAAAVTALSDRELMAVVETLPYRTDDAGRAVLDTSHERMVQAVAVASGLGASSAHTWLKIPPVERIAEVAATTSLPILLLGGDSGPGAAALAAAWARGLREPNVRGLIPGRALLYPHDGDVEGAAVRAVEVVHG
ncbi:hypothetical protein [Kineosporia sp. A_224]|uniref:Cgl0159 family (beta/alpha)8-fold protein n=1 Tax=Kineosporia sp. A_224 TaxID=1962180 RepID=UPI000B4B92AC|nr:hypothetical protein [Kineosporia sp. A_224]